VASPQVVDFGYAEPHGEPLVAIGIVSSSTAGPSKALVSLRASARLVIGEGDRRRSQRLA
jgi:hypothetical protein